MNALRSSVSSFDVDPLLAAVERNLSTGGAPADSSAISEVMYPAKSPSVARIGLAARRGVNAFLRYEAPMGFATPTVTAGCGRPNWSTHDDCLPGGKQLIRLQPKSRRQSLKVVQRNVASLPLHMGHEGSMKASLKR